MKNKKTAYILLPLVLLLWGIIIYRIYNGTVSLEKLSYSSNNTTSIQVAATANTFSITANYRDPFLGNLVSENKPLIKTNRVPPPTKAIIPWPNVVYGGMIKNQKSTRQLAMVKINEQDKLLKEGEETEGIKLLKIYKDSVFISFQNEKKIVKK